MAFVSAWWPSSEGSRLRAIASRWMSRSGKLPSTDSKKERTSSGKSWSCSTPLASSTSPRNSISRFLAHTTLRTSSQEISSQCCSITPSSIVA